LADVDALEVITCYIHPCLFPNAGVGSWLREQQDELFESFTRCL